MTDRIQGKHVAGAMPAQAEESFAQEAATKGVSAEGIGKDASGNTVVWKANEDGGWTPVVLKKKRHTGRIVAIVLVSLVAVLGAVYAGGWWYFCNHVLPNTTMVGSDMSYKTTEELVQIADSIGSNYSIAVKGETASFTVSAKDAAAGIDGGAVANRVIDKHTALRWPLEFANDHDITDVLLEEFNTGGMEDDLRKQIDEYNKTAKEPENAFIEFDAESSQYRVHPETPGTKLIAEPILKAALGAMVEMSTEASIPADALVPAEITQDDERLNKAVDEANNYSRANLDLVLGDTEIHAATIDSSQISQWVTIDENYKVKFDEDAMNAWIEDLANSLNTVGTERTYTRPSDGAEFVVSGGSYGWEIDNEALIEQVRTGIVEGQQAVITVPTFSEGYTYNGPSVPDWGAFADVDLSQQHARFFNIDGECVWESDVITGAPDGVHDTTPGVWRVLYTESPSVLRGEMMSSGVREYETRVQYWMQFTNSGMGFHDATWQWAFGGNSYAIGYGSHGCVNLPYDAAEQLFGLIEAGNAVIVHW